MALAHTGNPYRANTLCQNFGKGPQADLMMEEQQLALRSLSL